MRDLIAGLIALGLFLFALGLVSTLRFHQRGRERERRDLASAGRAMVAEIPHKDGLALFTADDECFHWHGTAISKDRIQFISVLINGTPLTSYRARRYPSDHPGDSGSFTDRPEGIAHDRWDVLVRTDTEDTLVECGSIRERVSQELARRVFDAIRADMEHRDGAAGRADPAADR